MIASRSEEPGGSGVLRVRESFQSQGRVSCPELDGPNPERISSCVKFRLTSILLNSVTHLQPNAFKPLTAGHCVAFSARQRDRPPDSLVVSHLRSKELKGRDGIKVRRPPRRNAGPWLWSCNRRLTNEAARGV